MRRKKTRLLALAALCALLLSGCGASPAALPRETAQATLPPPTPAPETPPPQTPEPEPAERINVVCYGDSNTYGSDPAGEHNRYPADVRWTTLLAERLGSGYQVIPEGMGGRTAGPHPTASFGGGVDYLSAYLLSHPPTDVVIVMLGTNDCLLRDVSAEEITQDIRGIIEAVGLHAGYIQGYVPQIVLVAPAALKDTGSVPKTESAVQKSRDLAPLYRQLAEDCGCLFLDATDAAEVSDLDGIHLTEAGHSRLAALLYEVLTA